MRTVSSGALAKITGQAAEPIVTFEILWVEGGQRYIYADREFQAGVRGRVREVGSIDAVIQVSSGGDSQEIEVTLSDLDGEIKTIMDSNDIHKRPCWVYQYFNGLDYATDKFLLFKGFISSPLTWNEADRTVKFTVISKIEDTQIGFSIEEGDFIDPPKDLLGKPWPLCFGTTINTPTVKVQALQQGTLAQGVGIRDPTLITRLQAAKLLTCPSTEKQVVQQGVIGNIPAYDITITGAINVTVYEKDPGCVEHLCEQVESLQLQYDEQGNFQFNTFTVYGGEKFPQDKQITLDINGAKFFGKMHGNVFTVSGRRHPKVRANGSLDLGPAENTIKSHCPVPPGGDGGLSAALKKYWGSDRKATTMQEVHNSIPLIKAVQQQSQDQVFGQIPQLDFFWATGGSKVTLDQKSTVVYITNLLPSTIHRVAAYRNVTQGRVLCVVPESYYTTRTVNYTSYTAVTEIIFDRFLSTRNDGWEDEVFVTQTSSVGPNTVDIIQWIIEFYTDFEIDTTSFDEVRDLIDNYPSHFPILDRPNVVEVLQDIAYQARCALYLRDDKFYIKYLSLEPDSDMDIDILDDAEAKSFEIFHTDTEDLVTEYTAEWQEDYAVDAHDLVILRHNVKKYGTHKERKFFYIYNIIELVRKSATFWLIRKSMTWRKLRFSTHFDKLQLETFDCATIDHQAIADNPVKCICEKADFDSENRKMEFEFWTPIPSGSRTPYNFAWPADVEELDLFPSIQERLDGMAGSGGGPNFHTIAPPNHPLSNPTPAEQAQGGFTVQDCEDLPGPFETSKCRPDFGDPKPSDRNDKKPTPKKPQDTSGEIHNGTNPVKPEKFLMIDLKKQTDKAKDDANNAQNSSNNANDNAGGDQNETDDVTNAKKDKDDPRNALPRKKGGNCTVQVRVLYAIPNEIHRRPGEDPYFGNNPGDEGLIVDKTDTRLETTTFNGMEAAIAYRDEVAAEIQAKVDNYGFVVGTESAIQASLSAPDLGTDREEFLENGDPNPNFNQPCPTLPLEDQHMTAFVNDDFSTPDDDVPEDEED